MYVCFPLLLGGKAQAFLGLPLSSTLHKSNCKIFTARFTLHTERCTLHTAYCTTHTKMFTRHTLHTAHCTLSTAHCTLHTAQLTPRTTHSAPRSALLPGRRCTLLQALQKSTYCRLYCSVLYNIVLSCSVE